MLQVTTGSVMGLVAAGREHHAARRFVEAEAAYMAAYRIAPNDPEVMLSLGTLALDVGNMPMAVTLLSRAVELNPKSAMGFCNLGAPLQECGRLDDAIAALRRALEIDPNMVPAASALLLMLQYHPGYDAKAILAESRKWNDGLVKRLAPTPYATWANERSAGRKLKVGFVSGDPGNHPVVRFMRPLLAHHDRALLEMHFYSVVSGRREPVGELGAFCEGFHKVAALSDQALAEKVRADGIDILVDLAMHTAGGRPLVFARKPAPVQACYLAYPGTTGLSAMDWRLSDGYLDPVETGDAIAGFVRTDDCYSEKTLRLKSFWCYEAAAEAGEVAELPAARNGFVTFGCLNNFAKVSGECLRAWGMILARVAGSRMILFCPVGDFRERAIAGLAAGGAADATGRVEFVERQSLVNYYATYGRIDVGLDPFPFCGGTTTCDALWMGVPVVTLAGNKAVGRSGVSILVHAGVEGSFPLKVEEYVQVACQAARDLKALAERRAGLRELMKGSVLMDGVGSARDVERALREMWVGWCGK